MADQLVSAVLWKNSGDWENHGTLNGHKGAILDLHWSRDARVLFSGSADAMLASWDTETGQRIRRHIGHEEIINSMDVSKRGEEILVSASDDGHIGVSHGTANRTNHADSLVVGSPCKERSRLYRNRISRDSSGLVRSGQ